jgi:hypothetical protein
MNEGKPDMQQFQNPESTKNDPKGLFFRFKQRHISCALAL